MVTKIKIWQIFCASYQDFATGFAARYYLDSILAYALIPDTN